MAETPQQQQLLTMLQHYQGSDQYQTLMVYIDRSDDYESASDLHSEVVRYINKRRLAKKMNWREQGELLQDYITLFWNMVELHTHMCVELELEFEPYQNVWV